MGQEFVFALASAVVVSLLSFVGVVTLSLKEKQLKEYLLVLVGFSAGALMGGALLHLMPESLETVRAEAAFTLLLAGFIFFFMMEKLFYWRHCHEGKCDVHPFTYLNLVGDGIHNFVDGIVIAVSYAAGLNIGIVSTLAIVFHEIPQELGDFGVLVYGGMKKKKALFYNFLSALAAVAGVVAGQFLLPIVETTSHILPLATGGFLYISASDLVPELHKEPNQKKSVLSFIAFLAGLGFMYAAKMLFG